MQEQLQSRVQEKEHFLQMQEMQDFLHLPCFGGAKTYCDVHRGIEELVDGFFFHP